MDLNTRRMSRADSKALTREALLASASQVFAEKGYIAATVEEIAAGAGFTRGAFYANFTDKAEVLWELAEQENQAAFDQLAAAVEAVDLGDKLAAAQAWFEGRLTPRPLRRAVDELLLHVGRTPEGRPQLAMLFDHERRSICLLLESVADLLGTDLPVPAEHLAAMGFALGNGLHQQHVADPEAVPASLFADAQAYLWLGAMAVAADPGLLSRGGGAWPPGAPPAAP